MENKFWKDVWPLILKSPLMLFLFAMTYVMGYGISYLIFSYRKEDHKVPFFIHLFFGLGYSLLMFCVVNIKLIIKMNSSITLQALSDNSVFTVIISFAVIFVVTLIVVYLRERK
jgi:hypothetical protein